MTQDLPQLALNLIILLVCLNVCFSIAGLILGFIARRTENKHDDAVARLINNIAKKFLFGIDLLRGTARDK
jgi:hypothetical protein